MLDYHFVTDRLAVGAAIWSKENMLELVDAGFTHIVNMQCEFDDSQICDGVAVEVLWNGCDDDLLPKSYDWFSKGVEFTLEALKDKRSKIYFHCQAGVHRSPMMLLAVMAVLGQDIRAAAYKIREARPLQNFPPVYFMSVQDFVLEYRGRAQSN